MPIYEYRCLDCEKHIEKMQKPSDAPLEKCEKCGGRLEKQWSLSGFQFKGAGWYVTDYSRKQTDAKNSDSAKTDSDKNAPKDEKKSADKSTVAKDTTSKETASSNSKIVKSK